MTFRPVVHCSIVVSNLIPHQVMVSSFEVFSSWDDEFDKLQGLLRDLVKKKREEHLRMVWRVNPAHKRLQGRLDHMRKLVIITILLFSSLIYSFRK